MKLKHIGLECMLINSMFIAETNKIFGEYKFCFAPDIEEYRQNLGLSPRPKEFELTEENFERLIKRSDKQ